MLALEALRAGDRAVLIEQQPAEAQALQQSSVGKRNVAVVCGDGYAALKTYLPPRENRGLVLIDPPYEAESEFADAERALRLALCALAERRVRTLVSDQGGIAGSAVERSAASSGLRKLLRLELTVRPADSPIGLNGSGLVIANPPWKFDAEMTAALAEAHAALSDAGGSSVEWLVGE